MSMESVSEARLRFVRVAPRKVRLVADLVRGQAVEDALKILKFTPKRSAPLIGKLIQSALASATQADPDVDVDRLFVQSVFADGGPTLRRYLPRAHGRATRLRKRTSHITVSLGLR
jgi:large subunit ribosomal protein L22